MYSPQLPALSPDTRAFWTRGARGALAIHRCERCRFYSHPPQPVCPRCHSLEIGPVDVCGRAAVVSFSINHQPWLPEQPVPFVFAMVELAEQAGLWVMTKIVDCR